jgi:asparagine synthase (glutamine-hydrolysing)
MLYLEAKHFLCDHNLNYADKMSMAVGVESRVPLLDPDLIELATRMAPGLKQHGATGKWIFKKAMQGVLPEEVIWRPKTGFGAPVRRWLRQELRPLVDELLSEKSVRERGLFDPVTIRTLRQDDTAGRVDGSYTLLSLLCIELWCRAFLPAAYRGLWEESHSTVVRNA